MLILDRGKNVEEMANVKGKVTIGKNVVLSEDSLIRGPAIIGDNTVIQDKTFIGPYTLLPRVYLFIECKLYRIKHL